MLRFPHSPVPLCAASMAIYAGVLSCRLRRRRWAGLCLKERRIASDARCAGVAFGVGRQRALELRCRVFALAYDTILLELDRSDDRGKLEVA